MTYKELKDYFNSIDVPDTLHTKDGRIRFSLKHSVINNIDYIEGIIAKGIHPKKSEHALYCKDWLLKLYRDLEKNPEGWNKPKYEELK